MLLASHRVGDRIRLRVRRYELQAGTLGTVEYVFESVPAYLIVFDGQTDERFVWRNILVQEEEVLQARRVGAEG
jgi:hypothetical protein